MSIGKDNTLNDDNNDNDDFIYLQNFTSYCFVILVIEPVSIFRFDPINLNLTNHFYRSIDLSVILVGYSRCKRNFKSTIVARKEKPTWFSLKELGLN